MPLNKTETDIVIRDRQLITSERRITPERLGKYAEQMLERLRSDDVALRQYYVRAIVDRVKVGDSKVCIPGATMALEHAAGQLDATPGIQHRM